MTPKIKYKEIAFTVYAVTNMPRARKFYEGVLGLKPTRILSKAFVEYDIGSGTLAVGCAPDQWKPSRHGSSAALEVADFDDAMAVLKKKKIKPSIGPLENPSCWMVAIRDPDGNLITLHKRKRRRASTR